MFKKIFAVITVFALTTASVYADVFTDVAGHWAESEIQYGYENKIIDGYADGLFRPNGEITRAEFTKMLVASMCQNFGFDISEYADETHWASKYYNFAVLSGMWKPLKDVSHDGVYVSVLEGENYNYPIKRWEMAYMLYDSMVNVFDMQPGKADYADRMATLDLYGETIDNAIASCISEGLLTGDENGNFNASSKGTRAQALTIVNRVDRLTKQILQEITERTDNAEKLVNEKVKIYDTIPQGHPRVKFEMEDGKSFTLELYPEYAPQTVANFTELVKSGFYDGLKFHRVIEGFMAQGGDPNGDGTGGAEHNIIGEFSANGFTKNTLKHERGVISMARASFNNSASSQFFICFADASFLDGNYAAFGKVVEGMDVIDGFLDAGLGMSSIGEMSVPKKDVVIKKATVVE